MFDKSKYPLSRSEFYIVVLTLAAIYKASITSGRRTFTRNRTLTGNVNSKHLDNYAFDLVCDDRKDNKGLKFAANKCGFDAVIEEKHVHIEYDPKN